MACAFFLYAASGLVAPWWVVVLLLVLGSRCSWSRVVAPRRGAPVALAMSSGSRVTPAELARLDGALPGAGYATVPCRRGLESSNTYFARASVGEVTGPRIEAAP